MIKPEDLLDAYDSLCINAQKKIEAIFVRADQKKFAVAFKDNWSYFMIPPPSSMPPETLKMDQIILDASGNTSDLQTVAKNLNEPHVFLRLSHLLLDYSEPIDLLPVSCSLSQNSKYAKKISDLLKQLRRMCKSYRDLQNNVRGDAEDQDLNILGEFCKTYFWLGDSLAPVREKYARLLQGDKNRYKLLREKDLMRVDLYKKYWLEGLNDKEIFVKMNRDEVKLLSEGKTTRQCSITSYRQWKSRAIKSGKLPKKYLKKKMFTYSVTD